MTARADTKTQVRALLWEEARVGGAIAAACGAVGVVLLLMYLRMPQAWERDEYTTRFGALGIPLIAALLLVLNPDHAGHLAGGFSRRILRLPVQTHTAVAVSLFARTAIIFVLATFLLGIAAALFRGTPGIAPALPITLGYLIIQLADWLRGPIRGLTSLLLLALIGFVIWSFWLDTPGFTPFAWAVRSYTRTPIILPLFLFGALFAAYAVSTAVVHADRIGRRYGIPEIWEWPGLLSRRERSVSLRPFGSAVAAQIWFEVRRSKLLIPRIFGAVVVLLIAVYVVLANNLDKHGYLTVGNHIYIEEFYGYLSGTLFVVLMFAAAAHGIYTRVIGFRAVSGSPGYEFLQPLTDAQIATAKIASSALQFLSALCIATLVHVSLAGQHAFREVFPDALAYGVTTPREIVWILISRSLLAGLAGWLLLGIGTRTIRRMIGVVFGSAVLLGLFAELSGMNFHETYASHIQFMLAFVLIVLTLQLAERNHRAGAVTGRTVVAWLFAWLAFAWVLRYALVNAWYPQSLPLAEDYPAGWIWVNIPFWQHALAVLTALGCAAPLPLVYFATLSDVRRRRLAARNHILDAAQHAAVRTATRPWKIVTGTAVIAAAVWLGWPAAPGYVAYRKERGYPTSLIELDAWYPEPAGDNPADDYLAVRRVLLGHADQYLFRYKPIARMFATINDNNRSMGIDYQERVPFVGGEYPASGSLPRHMWWATEAYWNGITSHGVGQLRELATRDTLQSRYPEDFAQRNWPWSEDYSGAMNNLARELMLDVLYQTVHGETGSAMDSVAATAALANSLANCPSEGAQYNRFAIAESVRNEVEIILNRSVPRAEHLVRLQRLLEELIVVQADTKYMERGYVGASTRYLYGMNIRYADDESLSAPAELFAHLLAQPAGWRLALSLDCERQIGQLDHAWPVEWRTRDGSEMIRDFRAFAFVSPFHHYYASLGTWDTRRRGYTGVGLESARIAVAIERYRAARGALPKQLNELVPEFLPSLPLDFFSNDTAPLLYRVRDDGSYLVYSVGSDGEDDGGILRPDSADPHGLFYDIVLMTVAPMSVRTGPQVEEN